MQQAIDVAALPNVPLAHMVILRSKWYADIIDSLHAKCVATLEAKGVADIDTHVLPGSFEFPIAAETLMRQAYPDGPGGQPSKRWPPPDAIICLGVVLKGDTYHFEMIVDECVRGLGAVSRKYGVPIINEVLPVTDIAQAKARAADDEFNKGIEAAAAAIEIAHWQAEVWRSPPKQLLPRAL